MRNKGKRLISILLTLTMVCSMFVISVSAVFSKSVTFTATGATIKVAGIEQAAKYKVLESGITNIPPSLAAGSIEIADSTEGDGDYLITLAPASYTPQNPGEYWNLVVFDSDDLNATYQAFPFIYDTMDNTFKEYVDLSTLTHVDTVEINGVATPTALATDNSRAACSSPGIDANSVSTVTWTPALVEGKFAGETEYTATVTVTTDSTYCFKSAPATMTIGGQAATVVGTVNYPTQTLTLQYEFPATAKTFTVTAHYQNGGTPDKAATAVVTGGSFTEPTPPTYTDHTFAGWYTAATGGTTVPFPITVTADQNIYAQWRTDIKAAKIAITAPVAGATPQTASDITAQTGYTVTGLTWNQAMDSNGKFKYSTSYTANVTLTASTGYNFVTAAASAVTVTNSSAVSNQAVSATGTADNTLTFTVSFAETNAPNQHNVIFNGNGSDGGMMGNQPINENTSATLNTNGLTKTGYTFGGWATSQENADAGTVAYADGATINMGEENITLYAIWTPNTLTWNAPSVTGPYTYGADLTIAAPTLDAGSTDATTGTVTYAVKTVNGANTESLADYGLALKTDGTITGTPKKAGTLDLVITVTGKNGNQSDCTYAQFTIAEKPITVERKGDGAETIKTLALETDNLNKASSYIALQSGSTMVSPDTLDTVYGALTDTTGTLASGVNLTVKFYQLASGKTEADLVTDPSTAVTAMTAAPTAAGTYYAVINAPTGPAKIGNYNVTGYANMDGTAAAHYVKLTVTKSDHGSSGGGGGGTSSYTVKFDAGKNGKITKGNASTSVSSGSKVASSKVPTIEANDGYKFLGWSLDGKTTVDPTEQKITKSVTFTALYTEEAVLNKEDHMAYIKGYENGAFRPGNNITRAEVAAIFSRILKNSTDVSGSSASAFKDVAASAWYAPYVTVMEQQGLLKGYSDGTFRPEASITREEFTAMATRVVGVDKAGKLPFTDVAAGRWSADNIYTAYTNGWIKGYEDGTFRPEAKLTRAEAVKMVNAMLERTISAESIDGASYKTFSDVPSSHWAYYDVIEASNAHQYTKADNKETWTK